MSEMRLTASQWAQRRMLADRHDYDLIAAFGYSGSKLIEIIQEWEHRQMDKMTRQEAYSKMSTARTGKPVAHIPFSEFCDYLEALGLIEFAKDNAHIGGISFKELRDEADKYTAKGVTVPVDCNTVAAMSKLIKKLMDELSKFD